MEFEDAVRWICANGVALLRLVSRPRCELESNFSTSEWSRFQRTAAMFFGRGKHSRRAVENAEAGELPVAALLVLAKHARALRRGDRIALLADLCLLRGSVEEIDRIACARVRELNRAAGDDAPVGKRALRGGKNTDASGCRTFTVTGPERDIARFLASLDRSAGPRLGRTFEQWRYDALMQGTGNLHEVLTPHVVVSAPDWATLLRSEGDELIFGLTDGTTITGAELTRQLMSDHHVVALYTPAEGPVNLYRSQRLSNNKQRTLLAGASLTCDWKGCTTGADSCQDHHVVAWAQGGGTNLGNLAKLCRKHNGRNDDNPHAPPRNGRIEKDGPDRVWVRGAEPPTTNSVPIRELSGRSLAKKLSSQ